MKNADRIPLYRKEWYPPPTSTKLSAKGSFIMADLKESYFKGGQRWKGHEIRSHLRKLRTGWWESTQKRIRHLIKLRMWICSKETVPVSHELTKYILHYRGRSIFSRMVWKVVLDACNINHCAENVYIKVKLFNWKQPWKNCLALCPVFKGDLILVPIYSHYTDTIQTDRCGHNWHAALNKSPGEK